MMRKNFLNFLKPIMLNQHFFYISKEEMESYQAAFPSQSYQSIKGTLAIHQVVITPGSSNTIQYRNSSCACSACFNGEYTKYECLQLYKDYPKPFQMINYNFSISNKSRTANDDDNVDESFMDLNEDEVNEWQEEIFVETEAAKFIVKGDIAVIKTDDHPYYLLKLTSPPYETVSEITDDYRHTFPPYHRVVEGNYLEVFKECSDGSLYYVDVKQKAIVSAFCVVGNSPTLPTVTEKKCGKNLEMLLVDYDMHQVLSELNTE